MVPKLGSQPVLRVQNLCLSYPVPQKKGALWSRRTFLALNNVSFEIFSGDVICLLGHNGAGKSSLFSALSGAAKPSSGSIEKSTSIGLFGPRFPLVGNSSVRDNGLLVALDMGYNLHEISVAADEIIEDARLTEFRDFSFAALSTGMKTRFRFAIAMRYRFGVTLIDEGFASSDQKFRDYVSKELNIDKGSREAFIITDHNAFGLANTFNRALILQRGQLTYDGPFAEGMKKYEIDLRESTDGESAS